MPRIVLLGAIRVLIHACMIISLSLLYLWQVLPRRECLGLALLYSLSHFVPFLIGESGVCKAIGRFLVLYRHLILACVPFSTIWPSIAFGDAFSRGVKLPWWSSTYCIVVNAIMAIAMFFYGMAAQFEALEAHDRREIARKEGCKRHKEGKIGGKTCRGTYCEWWEYQRLNVIVKAHGGEGAYLKIMSEKRDAQLRNENA